MAVPGVLNYVEKLQENSIGELRKFFSTVPDDLIFLFQNYVFQQEWSTEQPVLSLKAIAILDLATQDTQEISTALKTIFAAQVITKDTDGVIAAVLLDAVEQNNWTFVFKLIELGVSIDLELDDNNNTLLHLACQNNKKKEALKLLELQANVHAVNESGDTPLHLACGNDMDEVTGELLRLGADPLVDNGESRSPLEYACVMGNEVILTQFRARFQRFEWEANLVAAYLKEERTEQALSIIQEFERDGAMLKFLPHAFAFPCISMYLMDTRRAYLEENLMPIRRLCSSLTLDQKLPLLVLLDPEEIVTTIASVPPVRCNTWMNTMVVAEEIKNAEPVMASVRFGLREIGTDWFHQIDWNNDDPTSLTTYLINRIGTLIRNIPLSYLAAAAKDNELSPIVRSCIRIMNNDQMCVVMPQLSCEAFLSVVSELPIPALCPLLRVATVQQKLAFLSGFKPPCDLPLQQWLKVDCEFLLRGLESLQEYRILHKKDPRADYVKLIVLCEEKRLTLPLILGRNLKLLQLLRKALVENTMNWSIIGYVHREIDVLIGRLTRIPEQLDIIYKHLQGDPLYHTTKDALKQKEPPPEFLCGISKELMQNPVTAHGHSFEKDQINTWLDSDSRCPICRIKVTKEDFVEDKELKQKIEDWEKKDQK